MAGTAFNSANWTGYDEQSWTNPDSALTDFTGVIDISNLSASFGSNVQSDGADIRITKGDNTELAYDLIDWDYNSGSPTGLIRFLWSGTLSSSGTQNVRVWVGYTGGTATAYSANETYGSDNAYDSNWEGYWPLSSDFNDRTSNGNDGTAEGGVSAGGISGQIGDATDFDDSGDGVNVGKPYQTPGNGLTVIVWANPDDLNEDQRVMGQWGDNAYLVWLDADGAGKGWAFATSGDASLSVLGADDSDASSSTWTQLALTFNDTGDVLSGYVDDGSPKTESSAIKPSSSSTSDVLIGKASTGVTGAGQCFDGGIQHAQLHSTARSADWIGLEYDQTNDNATFWGSWTWNSAGGGGISIPVVMHHRRLIGAA